MTQWFHHRELGYNLDDWHRRAWRDTLLHGVDQFLHMWFDPPVPDTGEAPDRISPELVPILAQIDHPRLAVAEAIQLDSGALFYAEELPYQLDLTLRKTLPFGDLPHYLFCARAVLAGLSALHSPTPQEQRPIIVHTNLHLDHCGFYRRAEAEWNNHYLAGRVKVGGLSRLRIYDPDQPRAVDLSNQLVNRPPEGFSATPVATPRLDMWAYGCLLYASRTGEYPFVRWPEYYQWRTTEDPEIKQRIENRVWRRSQRGLVGLRLRDVFPPAIWEMLSRLFRPAEIRADVAEIVAHFDAAFPAALAGIDEERLFGGGKLCSPTVESQIVGIEAMIRDLYWKGADVAYWLPRLTVSLRDLRRQKRCVTHEIPAPLSEANLTC